MSEIADSTIGMSVYNVLAIAGAMAPADIRDRLAEHEFVVPLAKVEIAVATLGVRGLIFEKSPGKWVAGGPPGCVVCKRDRNGDGWGDWKITNSQGRLVPLAQNLRQP